MAKRVGSKVVTGEVRFAFVNLFEARSGPDGGKPQWGLVIMIPKDTAEGKETYKLLKEAEKDAITSKPAKAWGGKLPRGLKSVIKDADTTGDDEASLKIQDHVEKYPEFAGHWYLSVNRKAVTNAGRKMSPPFVVDRRREDIEDETEVYSGCWGKVSVDAYCYAASGNNGVTFGLSGVQKLRDDENLSGGGGGSRSDFDVEEDEDSELAGLDVSEYL